MFKNKYIVASVKTAIVSYIFYLINFGGQAVLAHILVPEKFGILALSLSVVGIVEMFTTFPISMAYINHDETKTLFNSAIFSVYVYMLLKLIINILAYFVVKYFYGIGIATFVLFVFLSKLFVPLTSLLVAKLEKEIKFTVPTLLTKLSSSIGLGLAIVLALKGVGETSLLMREVTTPILLFLFMVISSKNKLNVHRDINFYEVKSLFKYSFKMLFSSGMEIAHSKVPFILIERLFGIYNLGLISQILYLVNLSNTLLSTFTQKVSFVFFSKYKNDKNRKNKGMKYSFLGVVFCTLPVVGMFIIYPGQILQYLWGDRWVGGIKILQYFSVFTLVYPVFTILKSYLYGHAKNHVVAISYIIGLGINVVGILSVSFLKLPHYNIAIIYTLSCIMMVVFSYGYSRRLI